MLNSIFRINRLNLKTMKMAKTVIVMVYSIFQIVYFKRTISHHFFLSLNTTLDRNVKKCTVLQIWQKALLYVQCNMSCRLSNKIHIAIFFFYNVSKLTQLLIMIQVKNVLYEKVGGI